ncbi:hypothetical protein [Demequina litorisediminis]|uniref:hypothetical protein n=1 Tax=Demequina litorisediminis TaxID=1849022 RepID=UPI0024E12D5D|nr:hypothetical protein [Demequina litorisediminis]
MRSSYVSTGVASVAPSTVGEDTWCSMPSESTQPRQASERRESSLSSVSNRGRICCSMMAGPA